MGWLVFVRRLCKCFLLRIGSGQGRQRGGSVLLGTMGPQDSPGGWKDSDWGVSNYFKAMPPLKYYSKIRDRKKREFMAGFDRLLEISDAT